MYCRCTLCRGAQSSARVLVPIRYQCRERRNARPIPIPFPVLKDPSVPYQKIPPNAHSPALVCAAGTRRTFGAAQFPSVCTKLVLVQLFLDQPSDWTSTARAGLVQRGAFPNVRTSVTCGMYYSYEYRRYVWLYVLLIAPVRPPAASPTLAFVRSLLYYSYAY